MTGQNTKQIQGTWVLIPFWLFFRQDFTEHDRMLPALIELHLALICWVEVKKSFCLLQKDTHTLNFHVLDEALLFLVLEHVIPSF